MGVIKFRDYTMIPLAIELADKNLDPVRCIQRGDYYGWWYAGHRGLVIPTLDESLHDNKAVISDVLKPHQIERESITPDTKVYVSTGCSLAKKEYSKLVTLVQDPVLADIVVAPYKFNYRLRSYSNDDVAIFLNTEAKHIFLLDNRNLSIKSIKGQKFINLFHPDYISREPVFVDLYKSADFYYQLYDAIMDSVCVYIGPVLYSKEFYPTGIDEALLSKKPFIYEDKFMSIMSDPSLNLTQDIVRKIYGMLSSSDKDTKSLGLQILSNYSWINYPKTMGYFYNLSSSETWKKLKVAKSGKIKFMLEFMEKSFYGEGRCDDSIFYNSLKS